MAKITVDVRERALMEHLAPGAFQTEQLILGDVLIASPCGERTLVLERKTIGDLASSLKDGRLHEQKARLLSTYDRRDVMYVIEGAGKGWPGSYATSHGGIKEAALEACMVNLSVRDGLCVLRTRDPKGTAHLIADLARRMTEKPGSYVRVEDAGMQGGAPPCIPARKGAALKDADAPDLLIAQIAVVPGVSAGLARRVVDHVAPRATCMRAFVEALTAPDAPRLTDVPGLGKKLEDSLWQALCRCAPPPKPKKRTKKIDSAATRPVTGGDNSGQDGAPGALSAPAVPLSDGDGEPRLREVAGDGGCASHDPRSTVQ
jgi:ERCC4-type nuclease